MKSAILVAISVVVIVIVIALWTVFAQDVADSEGLQNAIDACTSKIDNPGSSDHGLEICLNDAYNQYGSEEQKQIWFDDEH